MTAELDQILGRLIALHAAAARLRDRADNAAARFHTEVAQALADDVRAVDIAAACDVTRSRVYQWARKA